MSDVLLRIRAIDWSTVRTAYGPGDRDTYTRSCVPELLEELFSENEQTALDACSTLWNSICHQGFLCSASLPAAPFLIERLETASSALQLEIMDILSCWTHTYCAERLMGDSPEWADETIALLDKQLPLFKKIAADSEPGELLEYLSSTIKTLEDLRTGK